MGDHAGVSTGRRSAGGLRVECRCGAARYDRRAGPDGTGPGVCGHTAVPGPAAHGAVFSLIDESLAADPHLWVVATLRSDFLTDFLGTAYAALIHQPTLVGVLGRTELFEVIEKPAEQAALSFAPGGVARMVDDTEGGDALPLLAYTLQELFLRVSSGGTVTEDDYRRLGGVAGALSEHADRITADLRAADADTPVLSTLLKFVTLEHGEPTRRRAHRDDLTPDERTVTDAFVTGCLITSDNAVLDVVHEALFRQWAPLRQAAAASTDKLRRRTELERWAQDWERSNRQDAAPHHGSWPAASMRAGGRPRSSFGRGRARESLHAVVPARIV